MECCRATEREDKQKQFDAQSINYCWKVLSDQRRCMKGNFIRSFHASTFYLYRRKYSDLDVVLVEVMDGVD